MNKIIILYISLFLTVCPVFGSGITAERPSLSGDDISVSAKIDGMLAAEEYYSADSWMELGFASGLLLGLIGAGIITGVSQLGTVDPSPEYLLSLQDKSSIYKISFLIGYSGKAKRKRLSKSLIGGIIGTATFVFIYLNYEPLRDNLNF